MTAILLESIKLASPAGPTRVDPGDFQATAQAFADQQLALNDLMLSLRSGLASPAIGTDRTGKYFASTYRPAADAVMTGVATLATAIGDIAQGLAKAGTDHSRADAITKSGWQTTAYTTLNVTTMDTVNPQVVPEITGYSPWWLPGVLASVWPCADSDALARAVAAWHAAGSTLTDIQDQLHTALTALISNNSGPDLDALNDFWAAYVSGANAIFPALDTAITAIANGLTTYGQIIDEFQTQLDEAIVEAAAEAGLGGLIDIAFDALTDGVGALLSGPAGAAIASAAEQLVTRVCEAVLSALMSATQIQNIGVAAGSDLQSAIQHIPQPATAQHDAWETGDKIQPAPNPTNVPRGKFSEKDGEVYIAEYLQGRGHVVIPIHDTSGQGRTPDSLVDGNPVEFKTLNGVQLRKILYRSDLDGGQADEIFIRATSSKLTAQAAERELQAYYHANGTHQTQGNIQRVTVLLADGTRVTYPPGYGGL